VFRGSLVLLAAIKALRMRCKTRAKEVEREGVSAGDYAVVVRGLPADSSAEEIRVLFNRIAAMDAEGSATTPDVENGSPKAAGGAETVGTDREGGEVAAVHIARRERESLGEWRRLAEMQAAFRRLRVAADRRNSQKGEGLAGNTSEPAVDRAAASSGSTKTVVDKDVAAMQLQITKQEERVRQMMESDLAGQAVCAFVVRRRISPLQMPFKFAFKFACKLLQRKATVFFCRHHLSVPIPTLASLSRL
jgi:hypothetical protein